MDHSTKFLSVLVVAFIHMLLAIALLHGGLEPRWLLLYFITVAFYGVLYFRRRLWLRHQRGGLYRGLGYTAVTLGASLSLLFFYGVDLGVPLPLAVGVGLVAALVAAYFLFHVIVLHLEEEVQVGNVRPPV